MRYRVTTNHQDQYGADALIASVFENDKPPAGGLAEIDARFNGLVAKVLASGEFEPKLNKTTLLHGANGERLLLVGGGKPEELDFDRAMQMVGTAVRALPTVCQTVVVHLRGQLSPAQKAQATSEAIEMALLKSDFYKGDCKPSKLEDMQLLASEAEAKAAEQGLQDGQVIGEAVNFARRLADEPSNLMTPTHLADAAKSIASSAVSVEILERADMERLKMGSLLGVAKGSDEPPKLIVMRYTAPGNPTATVGLIGKGITFDTGGISLKPPANMHEMKTDMSGGADVIGVMKALAHFKPAVNVIGVVPATENMPGGHATKPGDVLRASDGTTIEVLNTDAEGRLVLADGMIYARRNGATHLVDIATLTGAIVTALGHFTTGAFGNDQPWMDELLAAAKRAGEKMWQLPLTDEYADLMKGDISDLKNIGPAGEAGSIVAAGFLRTFAGGLPWVHLDVAGTSRMSRDNSYLAKGATASGLRTMLELVRTASS